MADSFKCLAQLNPAATTATQFYVVPGGKTAVVSALIVANQAGTVATFRVSVRVAAAADNAKQYLFYDSPLNGNSSVAANLGITLAATDEIWVYASSANLSFNAFGDEVT